MCPIKIDRILNFEHVRSGDRPQKRLSNLSSIYLSYINGSLTKDGQTERSRGLLLMTSVSKKPLGCAREDINFFCVNYTQLAKYICLF